MGSRSVSYSGRSRHCSGRWMTGMSAQLMGYQVLHEFRALETTQAYLSDLKNMRKVTLQVPDEESLRKLEKLLNEADPAIGHYLWIEQPENVATCLALAPNDRGKAVRKVLDKSGCQLWR